MKDFIYCLIWLMWSFISHIIGVFDKKQIFAKHWSWKIEPKFATRYLIKKYGCLMKCFEKYNLVWLYEIV